MPLPPPGHQLPKIQLQGWCLSQAHLLKFNFCILTSREALVMVNYMGQQTMAAELKPIDHRVKYSAVGWKWEHTVSARVLVEVMSTREKGIYNENGNSTSIIVHDCLHTINWRFNNEARRLKERISLCRFHSLEFLLNSSDYLSSPDNCSSITNFKGVYCIFRLQQKIRAEKTP